MKTLLTLFIALALSAAAAEFKLLGATEAQLTERYGKPFPYRPPNGDERVAPFEKVLTYPVDDAELSVFILSGKCEVVLLVRKKDGITDDQIKQLTEQYGGEWKGSGNVFSRKDGGFAMRVRAGEGVAAGSGAGLKALRATRTQGIIKGL